MGLGKQAFIDKRENILNYRDFSLHTGKRMVYLAEGMRGPARVQARVHGDAEKSGTLSAKNAGEVVQDVLKVTGFARLFKMI